MSSRRLLQRFQGRLTLAPTAWVVLGLRFLICKNGGMESSYFLSSRRRGNEFIVTEDLYTPLCGEGLVSSLHGR